MTTDILHEFETLNLGHKRRENRARQLLAALTADPQASINAACHGWDETRAAYRFLDNDHVTPAAILRPHRQRTEERMKDHPVVLVVQDTTELDFSKHPPADIGVLNEPHRRGLYDHTHLAVTPQRLCLGVLDVEFFERSEESLGKAAERKKGPLEERESYRWLQGYRLACELARRHPERQIVSVADREGDLYDIFLEYERQRHQGPVAEYVIRVRHDRKTLEQTSDAEQRVRAELAASPLLAERAIELPRTPRREARTATLEIRAKSITVQPPAGSKKKSPVTLSLVLVEEVGRPADDETRVSWLLVSSLPVETLQQVLLVMEHYGCRWPIEPFFRVFKTGCQVEEIQLETTTRLIRCLLFYKIIAWRVLYVTQLGRECPELPCDVLFSSSEWKSAWKISTGEMPPAEVPSLGEFLPVLAKLGGYNARRTEGPPGPQCLWVAIRRITDFALAWEAFGPETRQRE